MEVSSPSPMSHTLPRRPVSSYGVAQIARCKPWKRDPNDEYGFLTEGKVRTLNRQQRLREKTSSEKQHAVTMTPVIQKRSQTRSDLGNFSCRQKSSSDNDLSTIGIHDSLKHRTGSLQRSNKGKTKQSVVPSTVLQVNQEVDLSDDYLDMNGYVQKGNSGCVQKDDPGGYYVEMNNNLVTESDVYECVPDFITQPETYEKTSPVHRMEMSDSKHGVKNHGRSKSYDLASARSGIYHCRPCRAVNIKIDEEPKTYENLKTDANKSKKVRPNLPSGKVDKNKREFGSKCDTQFTPVKRPEFDRRPLPSPPVFSEPGDYENCYSKTPPVNKDSFSSSSMSSRNSMSSDAQSINSEIEELNSRLVKLRELAHSASMSQSSCYSRDGSDYSVYGTCIDGRLDCLSDELESLKTVIGKRTSASEPLPPLTNAQTKLAKVDDLSTMVGPLTEEAVVHILHARYLSHKYLTNIGPTLLLLNPTNQKPFPKVLYGLPTCVPEIEREIEYVVTRYIESGHSQAVILGGYSGSGKTYTSHMLVRQLYEHIGGGAVTDSFKHISAALTVIKSLGTAATASNWNSSRVGYFLENQISDLSITKTKINCYFFDQSRVTSPPPGERNFHIFYQMLAGLTSEEKVKLHLDGYQVNDFAILPPHVLDHGDLKTNFTTWKTSLTELGIPFYDVMRALSAALLLSNVVFHQGESSKYDFIPSTEASSVSALLGISGMSLYHALTTRTTLVGGQKVKSQLDPINVLKTRDALIKALFTRTLSAIVKRANTMKRPTSGSTLSTDSSDSMHLSGQDVLTSTPNKYPGTPRTPSSSSGSGHGGHGFIGIVDMFGFEITQVNRFEQLCINMCSEVLEHIYTTHLFRNPMDCQRDEGIETEIGFMDNTAVVEILSAKRTGLVSILNTETYQQSCPAEFLNQLNSIHGAKTNLFQTDEKSINFTITHYGGKQTYNTTHFLETNRDNLPDDVVCIFSKHTCNFGFVSHLFSGDLRNYSEVAPKGMQHRIAPVPAPEPGSTGHEGKNTLAHDFSMKMDNLLKTLGHAKPHFIRCIKSSFDGEPGKFERDDIVTQLRGLQVLETVHLMSAGYPHRMRYKAFNSKYRFLGMNGKRNIKVDDHIYECKTILDNFLKAMDNSKYPYGSCNWSFGRKYIFLSEGARRQLELLRSDWKDKAATRIQAHWKCWQCAKKWKTLKEKRNEQTTPTHNMAKTEMSPENLPRPRKDELDHTDYMLLKKTCQLYGVKLDTPPPLPANRGYTVQGGVKMTFPQIRTMKQDYGEDGNLGSILRKGEEVKVTGVKRGFVIVEHQGHTMYIPHQLTDT